jgi:hypothetical protein
MSSLYQLDSSILELLENGFNMACVDLETGEIDTEKAQAYLEALQIERAVKIENIALFIKNLESDAAEIKAEEKNLKARREAKEKKAERLRNYLTNSLNGSKFETARVALAFRSSKQVVIDNMEMLNKAYIKEEIKYSADKTAIKKALDNGETVTGAHIEEKQNLQIK